MGRKTKGEYEVKKATYPNAGKVWYISAWFDGENGQRKKKRAWFSSQRAAQTEANERNDKIHRLGRKAAVQITGVLANMALECQGRLEVYGKSLSDATDHYLQHLESLNRSVPIRQMTAAVRIEFQRRIGAGEISQRHLETMLAALRRMDEQFGDRASSTISGSEIKSWLSASSWATKTRNNLMGYLHNSFGIAKELGLLNDNPLTEVSRFATSKVSKKSFPKFLTVEQMTKLLKVADPQLIPYLGICAFAGVRSSECISLTWEAVDLKRKVIIIPEHISKTGQERTIPIADNLLAWLSKGDLAGTGYIYPRKRDNQFQHILLRNAKEQAGLWPWRPRFQNALRKSFCSYHYEMHGSADRTAEYAGHDIRMLIKIYKHAVDHGEAVKYWQIFP
jgi:integrase